MRLFHTISRNRTGAIINAAWMLIIFLISLPQSVYLNCTYSADDKESCYYMEFIFEFVPWHIIAFLDLPREFISRIIYVLIVGPVHVLLERSAISFDDSINSFLELVFFIFVVVISLVIMTYIYMYLGAKTQQLILQIVKGMIRAIKRDQKGTSSGPGEFW